MEELLSRHRKEQRDLQSRVTQKKKSASKKTRKNVNDECERLEADLKAKQATELAAFSEQDEEKISKSALGVNGSHETMGLVKASRDDDLLASIAGSASDDAADKLHDLSFDSREGDESFVQQSQQQRKPNRQKARLARRAAEQDEARAQAAVEAANLPDLKTQERNKMLAEAKKRGLFEKAVAANGHCLYLAFADQMRQQQLDLTLAVDPAQSYQSERTENDPIPDFKKIRAAAADYIATHPTDFEPFLEEPIEQYVHKIRDTGRWGGQLELTALSKVYNININILQATGRLEKIVSDREAAKAHEIWLAYYRHGFGLGEHYNSLRKASPGE